jgi:WD40 repeat protein
MSYLNPSRILAPLIFLAFSVSVPAGNFAAGQESPQSFRSPVEQPVEQSGGVPQQASLPATAVWRISDPKITAKGVFKLAWSPDGKWLALQNRENVLTAFDVANQRPGFSIMAHDINWIETIQFSPNSNQLVTAAGSGEKVKIFDVLTGKLLQEIETTGQAAFFSPDGAQVIVLGKENVERYRVSDGKPLSNQRWRFEEEGAGGLAPNGEVVVAYRAVGRRNYSVEVLNPGEQKRIPLIGGNGIPSCLAFGPQNDWMAIGYPEESRIFLWEFQDGTAVRYLLRDHHEPIQSLTISADGRWLASADSSGVILIWDLLLRQSILKLTDETIVCRDLVFAPQGEWLAAASAGRSNPSVTVWDIRSGIYPRYTKRPDFDKLWNDLAASTVAASLSSSTEVIENFSTIYQDLRRRVEKELPPTFSGDISSLLDQLNDTNFSVREQAMNELANRMGESQLSLEDFLSAEIPLEARYRIKKILSGTRPTPKLVVGDFRRWQRLVFVCEKVNSSASIELLNLIAERHQHSKLRGEARQALLRLQTAPR